MTSWTPVGEVGRMTVASRGIQGPGEATFSMRGSDESYIVYSDQPIGRGQQVLCTDIRGPRTLTVQPWGERTDSLLFL